MVSRTVHSGVRNQAAWATAAAVLVACLGCGGTDPPTSCPKAPSVCPSTVPSWKDEVQAIVNTRCVPCHSPIGVEPNIDYTTYKGVEARAPTMLSMLNSCAMPPATAPQPTTAEREALLAWLVCGAPNN